MTNVILKGIRSVNPYCSFGFRRHRVKIKGLTIKGPFLQCRWLLLFQGLSSAGTRGSPGWSNLIGRCHFPWKRGLPLSKRTPKKVYPCWCSHWHRTHTGKQASKDILFGVSWKATRRSFRLWMQGWGSKPAGFKKKTFHPEKDDAKDYILMDS